MSRTTLMFTDAELRAALDGVHPAALDEARIHAAATIVPDLRARVAELEAQLEAVVDTVDAVHDERIEDPLEAVSMLARSRDLFAREASDLRRELNGRLNHDCVLVESERDFLRDEVTDLHMVAQSIKHYWQCDPDEGIPCVRCQRDAMRAERDRYLAAIVEAERLAMKGVRDIDDGTWISDIAILLRPIVEEAK